MVGATTSPSELSPADCAVAGPDDRRVPTPGTFAPGSVATLGRRWRQVPRPDAGRCAAIDKDLKRQGREDRLAGEAKEKLEHAKDKIEDVIDAAKDKLSHAKDKIEGAIDKTNDSTHRK